MHAHRIGPVVVCCGIALSAIPVRAQSPMSQAEAVQLFGAAGFRVSGNQPVNRCGAPANPRVTFVDINGDKRPEALIIDEGPCYAPAGRYFAVLAKAGTNWRAVISGNGTIQSQPTQTAGWLDMRVAEPACTRQFTFQGNRYVPVTDCAGRPAVAAAPPQSAPARAAPPAPPPAVAQAPAASSPPATGGTSATRLSTADEAAAFKAAGFTRRGNRWRTDCDEGNSPTYGPGTIEKAGDFNGDGRPDALITEGGSFCYGNTGQGFFLVTKTADGGWKLITKSTGIADFRNTRGTDGWPDIQVGGPGFCFPVVRWNGREYKLQRWEYEGKACKPPR